MVEKESWKVVELAYFTVTMSPGPALYEQWLATHDVQYLCFGW